MWFDWSDKQIIWEAFETIDPLKVTARIRPMVIVGFEGDGWLPVHDFVGIVRGKIPPSWLILDPTFIGHLRGSRRILAMISGPPSSASPGSISRMPQPTKRCWPRWETVGRRIGLICLTSSSELRRK